MSKYEIRMSIISWESKWVRSSLRIGIYSYSRFGCNIAQIYILVRYVTIPKKSSKGLKDWRGNRDTDVFTSPGKPLLAGRGVGLRFPAIRTVSTPGLLGTPTPLSTRPSGVDLVALATANAAERRGGGAVDAVGLERRLS